MAALKIRKGGTPPKKGSRGPRSPISRAFAAMEVNEFFLMPENQRGAVSGLASYWAPLLSRKFATRKVNGGMIEVWRVS